MNAHTALYRHESSGPNVGRIYFDGALDKWEYQALRTKHHDPIDAVHSHATDETIELCERLIDILKTDGPLRRHVAAKKADISQSKLTLVLNTISCRYPEVWEDDGYIGLVEYTRR